MNSEDVWFILNEINSSTRHLYFGRLVGFDVISTRSFNYKTLCLANFQSDYKIHHLYFLAFLISLLWKWFLALHRRMFCPSRWLFQSWSLNRLAMNDYEDTFQLTGNAFYLYKLWLIVISKSDAGFRHIFKLFVKSRINIFLGAFSTPNSQENHLPFSLLVK